MVSPKHQFSVDALLFFFLYHMIISCSTVLCAKFTLTNQCKYTIWPGFLSSSGISPLSTTGFTLQPGESNSVPIPSAWSGRLWGRTLCSTDPTGEFTCLTADCGSGTVECNGRGAAPPATLAEFTLNGAGGMDFYDVSLVDGYNLPMMVEAEGGSGGNCSSTGCAADLNVACPTELKLNGVGGESVACKSACEAFGDPRYCCSGAYATPDTCKPTQYSELFKSLCPKAYSYAYDDGTSTFTCSSANYLITFCPPPSPANSRKSAGGGDQIPNDGGGSNSSLAKAITLFLILPAVWLLF